MSVDKEYLHRMFNATSTDDGNGDIETYENWLERQLISRIEKLESLSEKPPVKEEIKTAIFEALGEASMMWNPRPSNQVFDSTGAKEIGDRLIEKIEALSQQPTVAVAWLSDEKIKDASEQYVSKVIIPREGRMPEYKIIERSLDFQNGAEFIKENTTTIDLEEFLKWYKPRAKSFFYESAEVIVNEYNEYINSKEA